MKTRDSLGVFWEGEEVDGMLFYTYRAGPPDEAQRPEFPLHDWPPGTLQSEWRLFDDSWVVFMWTLRVFPWQADWRSVVELTLRAIGIGERPLAWCASEGNFVDPPWLLLPEEMTAYAAFSQDTGFICHTDIDEEFATLSDHEQRRLHALL